MMTTTTVKYTEFNIVNISFTMIFLLPHGYIFTHFYKENTFFLIKI